MPLRSIPLALVALLAILHAQLWVGRGSIPNVSELTRQLALQREKNDLARIELVKGSLVAPVDQLTINIGKTPDGNGEIKIMWEATVFTAAFSVKK